MPETFEPKVKETLRAYARGVKALPNEAAKRSRFAAVIAELFPGTNAVSEFSRGVEKLIRIDQAAGQKGGRADAYYGNAIIEFENCPPHLKRSRSVPPPPASSTPLFSFSYAKPVRMTPRGQFY